MDIPGIIGKYKSGRYQELPEYVRHMKTDSIKITCDRITPINLDGEVRMAKVVEMKAAQEKIRFFYPKGLSWQAKSPALTR